MIRINLMAVERGRTTPKFGAEIANKVTLGSGAILVSVLALVVWQLLAVRGETARLDEDIRVVNEELASRADVVERRNQFEAQTVELARRVALIERLRGGQGGPVRLLDQVSRGLPEGVWLTELRQDGNEITIQGQATSLTLLSDFVVALESSGFFALPVELIDGQVETQDAGDVVRFELRAVFTTSSS